MTDNDINDVLGGLYCKAMPLMEHCPECRYLCETNSGCSSAVARDAIAIINYQKAEIERFQKELEITRQYIHDSGLEWDLLSYSKRKGGDKE